MNYLAGVLYLVTDSGQTVQSYKEGKEEGSTAVYAIRA